MTGVILDTTYLYEAARGRSSFSPEFLTVLDDRDTAVVYSAVSLWEMRIKYERRHPSGERKSEVAPQSVAAALHLLGIEHCLDLRAPHASTSLSVPLSHRDPFDEQLLIQAQVEDMRLLTRDRLLVDHPLAWRP